MNNFKFDATSYNAQGLAVFDIELETAGGISVAGFALGETIVINVTESWSRSFEQDSAKAKWIAARVGPLQFRARGVTEGGRRSPTGDTSCARRKIHAAAARSDGVK